MPAPEDVSSESIEPRTLEAFALANDRAAATTKKLEKQAALAAYLRSLDDEDDLADATRFAAGQAFGAGDERVLGASSAMVRDVIGVMFSLPPADWSRRTRTAGETGEAMGLLWAEAVTPGDVPTDRPLVLGDLRETFDALSRVGKADLKRDLLRDLFARIRLPREAAYVGKIIGGDLRTGVREGVLHAAIAEAFDREFDAVRRAVLLVGDLGEVSVMARRDRLGQARFKLFHPISFMLASPMETADDAAKAIDGGAFLAEDKLDGIRAQVHKEGDGALARVAIFTRTLDRIDESFPDIVAHARTLPGDWLIDGEIVAFDDERRQALPFAIVQKRLGRKAPPASVMRQNPCRLVAFDLLYAAGDPLLDTPLATRKARLVELLDDSDQVLPLPSRAVTTAEEIEQAFEAARAARNEGLILKDSQSTYAPGRRGRAWLKLKTHLPTLDVVVTAAEYGHGKRRDVLSDYTFAVWDQSQDPPELVNIGKAYSGVTDEEIAELTETFLDLAIEQYGRVYKVRPTIVFEVAFDAIQESKRHNSGLALRFPRIKRIRRDRKADDADTLARAREIFEHEQNFNRVEPASPESQQMTLFD